MSSNDIIPGEATAASFRPALIVVDMQEDFCPPNGSLAIQGARALAPIINSLLYLPGFVLKISTQDFHPTNHISFAVNHPAPNNIPFQSIIAVHNPVRPATINHTTTSYKDKDKHTTTETETRLQRLWPVHCVANTPGACIIPEIQTDKISVNIRKGMDARADMKSAFVDTFGNNCVESGGVNLDLDAVLKEHRVSDLYVVGVAGDYCVKSTSIDAEARGFRTMVVEEGTKCVDPGDGWEEAKREMLAHGVRIVSIDGPEVRRVRDLGNGGCHL
ncbi:nicotinamidase [Paracoccidioides brasiliensis Pb18]|uniref:nicotinamidase n=1 Tax=Paracoccidioides brasiliensis (strain Pb18) TaxID=502780 RepID=C1GAV1_PARBD|nr:nicotinamidase [Paracoccidioides brasiliensis Pb18]EEH48303.2 hypothetical protein PADG_04387 [Paracoccidioides brasiliensis Pb18]